jgi:hypothetical protein
MILGFVGADILRALLEGSTKSVFWFLGVLKTLYTTPCPNIFWNRYLDYGSEYINILVYVLVALLLTCILITLAYLVTFKNIDFEKLSAYECGFESLDDARKTYDIHFYIVGVLFLIFDLEIAFLLP